MPHTFYTSRRRRFTDSTTLDFHHASPQVYGVTALDFYLVLNSQNILLILLIFIHIHTYIHTHTHTHTYTHAWGANLIPGIVAACRWGVESGKLVYSSTFGHVPTCVYMSHRPNESFFPEKQRK